MKQRALDPGQARKQMLALMAPKEEMTLTFEQRESQELAQQKIDTNAAAASRQAKVRRLSPISHRPLLPPFDRPAKDPSTHSDSSACCWTIVVLHDLQTEAGAAEVLAASKAKGAKAKAEAQAKAQKVAEARLAAVKAKAKQKVAKDR